MIRPANFRCNEQTMGDNTFQQEIQPDGRAPETEEEIAAFQAEVQAQALAEFDEFVAKLRARLINVVVVQDTETPDTPDSIFPNNWLSLHKGGRRVTYPMKAENRRAERELEPDVLAALSEAGHEFPDKTDLSHLEDEGAPLEGTGSMVLDRQYGIVYAALSERTVPDSLETFASKLGYRVVSFDPVQVDGAAIYHTNVLMSVGNEVAVLCPEAIPQQTSLDWVRNTLEETGHTILEISMDQLNHFAGNMLEVHNTDGDSIWVMSQQAHDALTEEQRAVFTDSGSEILTANLQTIETAGGGSARCMLAEVF
jgi:hypothetical protein